MHVWLDSVHGTTGQSTTKKRAGNAINHLRLPQLSVRIVGMVFILQN